VRGNDTKQGSMLSLVTPEKRVPEDHPLRQVKTLAEDALRTLSPVFEQMYSSVGRPSIPPGAAAEGDTADGAVHGA
jgi:hypothetical protein